MVKNGVAAKSVKFNLVLLLYMRCTVYYICDVHCTSSAVLNNNYMYMYAVETVSVTVLLKVVRWVG